MRDLRFWIFKQEAGTSGKSSTPGCSARGASRIAAKRNNQGHLEFIAIVEAEAEGEGAARRPLVAPRFVQQVNSFTHVSNKSQHNPGPLVSRFATTWPDYSPEQLSLQPSCSQWAAGFDCWASG